MKDDSNDDLYRVTYTIDGDDITFSDPIAVEIVYQDKSDGKFAVSAATTKAAVVIFATKEESRPGAFENESQVNSS